MTEKHTKSKASYLLGVSSSQTPTIDSRHSAIKNLLESTTGSVDEKVATVKTAHYVDKERFQNAFRALMDASKQ